MTSTATNQFPARVIVRPNDAESPAVMLHTVECPHLVDEKGGYAACWEAPGWAFYAGTLTREEAEALADAKVGRSVATCKEKTCQP